jgi:ABC-type bacteriocin/lantibiotic exporter with double-glycine peptidase domain
MSNIIYFPDVLQTTDYDCGVQCVQTILAYFGEDHTEYELEELLSVDKENGTSAKSITNFFKKLKFKVWYGKLDIDKLKKLVDKKMPTIVLLQAWSDSLENDYKTSNEYGHYVVCCGYSEEKQEIYFEDPAIFGIGYLSYKEFLDRWHGEDDKILDKFGIVIWGKKVYDYKKTFVHLE